MYLPTYTRIFVPILPTYTPTSVPTSLDQIYEFLPHLCLAQTLKTLFDMQFSQQRLLDYAVTLSSRFLALSNNMTVAFSTKKLFLLFFSGTISFSTLRCEHLNIAIYTR